MKLVIEYETGGDGCTYPPFTATRCLEFDSAEAFLVGFDEARKAVLQTNRVHEEARERLSERIDELRRRVQRQKKNPPIDEFNAAVKERSQIDWPASAFTFANLQWEVEDFVDELPKVYELQEWFSARAAEN